MDYWGFQYLRDNDPDEMGHNTSFLTHVSCNVLDILDQDQLDALVSLARGQVALINDYGYKRYPLMKAFRRLVDGELQRAVNMFLGIEVPGCGIDCDNDGRASIAEVQKVVSGFLGEPAEC